MIMPLTFERSLFQVPLSWDKCLIEVCSLESAAAAGTWSLIITAVFAKDVAGGQAILKSKTN